MSGSAIDEEMKWLFKAMKGIQVPTRAEELDMLRRSKAGDSEVKKQLVWRNMPLVIKEASRMVRQHNAVSSDKVDLLQSALSEGAMGLFRAIDAFDIDYGTKFSTYAMWHVKESVRRALVFDKNSVKPVKTLERSRDVKVAITMMSFIENFDQADHSDDPADDLHKSTVIKSMMIAMNSILSKKEQYILRNRYGFNGDDLTFSDVASMMGLSTERVRQIENQALKKLWEHLLENELAKLEQNGSLEQARMLLATSKVKQRLG